MEKTFVLDWDGTFTDNKIRARQTLEQMIILISKKYKIEVTEKISENKKRILENERNYIWVHRGSVAAYCEDPLILNNMAIVELLREINPRRDISEHWSETLRTLGEAYSQTSAVYVPNAMETLANLLDVGQVIVVTNSNPEKVSLELRNLLDYVPENLQLRGYAKKYKIDPTLSEVKEAMITQDGRKINLRRREYYDILSKLDSSSTYLVGDGFSCDLALPIELGFHVCLINDFELMDWARAEIDVYDKGKNISLISGLLE